MKKWLFLVPALWVACSLHAQEEEYDIEEGGCDEICIPEDEIGYYHHYHCPHRYCDFYDYENRDIDATWPGKLENSFIDSFKR